MSLPSAGRNLFSAALIFSLLSTSTMTSAAAAGCSSSKDIFLNPFGKNSAHHRPIGTGAKYASSTHAATRDWLKASTLTINVGSSWGAVIEDADASDPTKTVNYKQVTHDYGKGLPVTVRFPSAGLATEIKRSAGNGGFDGRTVIYDRVENSAHAFFQFDWDNGSPKATIYRGFNIRGLGHGTRSGQKVGSTATGISAMFGVLRGHEINTPGHEIEHALVVGLPNVPSKSGTQCNIMLSRDIVLPATSRDGAASKAAYNTGNIPYGGLLALPPSVNIDNLGLSEPGRRLARAIRNYGMYVVDGGGCGKGSTRADQNINSATVKALRNDIPKIYKHIRMVLNNDVLGNPVAGGGQALAPNCAAGGGAVASSGSGSSSSGGDQSSTSQGSNSGGSPTTQAADLANDPNWIKAVKFYNWAQSAKKTMARNTPGSAAYNKAKANYDRNIANYITHAARAGVKVTANISPTQATSGATSSGSSSTAQSSGNSSSQDTNSTSQGSTSGGSSTSQGSSSGGSSTTQAADLANDPNWIKAVKFYNWAQSGKKAMARSTPGSAAYTKAEANYDRNIKNYITHAARVGVKVTADISPTQALG